MIYGVMLKMNIWWWIKGDDSWVSGTIKDIHKCLNSDTIPESADDCDLCAYRKAASEVLGSGS